MAAQPHHLRAVPEGYDEQAAIASSVSAMLRITNTRQQDLAAASDIEATALSKALKQVRRIQAVELGRIAAALDTPVDVFYLGGDEIERRAKNGVLAAIDGPDTPPGQEIHRSGCNDVRRGQVLAFPTAAIAA